MPGTDQRALVVDDSEIERTLAKAMLSALNVNVIHEAEDGVIARKKLTTALEVETPYNLLLVDWNMPGGSGLKLLQFIRSHNALKNIKVVMMTSNSSREVVESAIAAGCDDFIVKPLTLELITEKLKKPARQR